MAGAVDVREIAAEFDRLAAHAEASAAEERQRTIWRARHKIVGPLAGSADREGALGEPSLAEPLSGRSVVSA
jgi:hypothetical protein